MKWDNERTVEELKKKRKTLFYYNIFLLIMGTFFMITGWFFYMTTGLIGLPIIIYTSGIGINLLACLPNNYNVLIYLKEKEEKKDG